MYRRPHAGAVLTMCTLHALTTTPACCPMTLHTLPHLFGMRLDACHPEKPDAAECIVGQSIVAGCLSGAKIDVVGVGSGLPVVLHVPWALARLTEHGGRAWAAGQVAAGSVTAHLGAARRWLLVVVIGRLRDDQDGDGAR